MDESIMHNYYRFKENFFLKLWEGWVLASTIVQIQGWAIFAYFSQAINRFGNKNTYKVS